MTHQATFHLAFIEKVCQSYLLQSCLFIYEKTTRSKLFIPLTQLGLIIQRIRDLKSNISVHLIMLNLMIEKLALIMLILN